jgi:nucleoside-diphosphate-sugar epimerase
MAACQSSKDFTMRVFVTGATGFVGSAVVRELIAAGHSVLGLARTETGAATVRAAGAEAVLGSLEDVAGLQRAAGAVDGVIHTGFNHDFSRFAANCELDRRAIEAIGAALAGSQRPLLATSGLAVQAPTDRDAVESDRAVTSSAAYPRASEEAIAAVAARGVRASVVRLPPSVHGDGDHAFVPLLIKLAREKGVAAYIGEGRNRWPAVHRLDAARMYRLALEHGVGEGPFHAVAEDGILFRDIAAVIGRRLNVPVVSRSGEEAAAHFGWFSGFAGMDRPANSERSSRLLGWKPQQPGLLADIDRPAYFAS